jgi:acylphosphatase
MAEMGRVSARVHGRVQGVCFRYFVTDIARRLGLKGYVHNLASGDALEVQAEGEMRSLQKLVESLRAGPPGAQVTQVELDWSSCSGRYRDFDIRY